MKRLKVKIRSLFRDSPINIREKEEIFKRAIIIAYLFFVFPNVVNIVEWTFDWGNSLWLSELRYKFAKKISWALLINWYVYPTIRYKLLLWDKISEKILIDEINVVFSKFGLTDKKELCEGYIFFNIIHVLLL